MNDTGSGAMSKKILLIGGGGHCHSVMDSVLSENQYEQVGVVAKDKTNYEELKSDKLIRKYLIGIDAELSDLFLQGWREAFITLGSIGNPFGRIRIYDELKRIGFNIPTLLDLTATISQLSEIGAGSFVGKSAVVNAGSSIGQNSIINTGAIIEHDCNIGSFSHISTGTVLCGNVTIGDNSHIGAGTIVRQGIIIGKNVLIGAGSVVVKNIPDGVKAYGNPCKVVD